MVRQLFEIAGIDYAHWRALVRAALAIQLRSELKSSLTRRGGASASIVGSLLLYVMFGGVLALVVRVIDDVFTSALILMTFVMGIVSLVVLLDFQSVITSPDDYQVLAFRPVSSRTILAARITHVLIFTSGVGLAVGFLPAAAYMWFRGFHPLMGVAALFATELMAISTTMTLVQIYARLMRFVQPSRLRTMLSYVQLAMSFVVYSVFLMPGWLLGPALTHITLTRRLWYLSLPPVWFASFVQLAGGPFGAFEVAAVVFALIAPTALVWSAAGKLSLDYTAYLGELTAAAEQRAEARRPRSGRIRIFQRDEGRAVSLLVRAQFRNDTKFRLAILSILPMTGFYILTGIRESRITSGAPHSQGWAMLYFAVFMVPMILKYSLTRTDAFRASWIFFVSPAHRDRLVVAARDFVMMYFVLPYLCFLTAALTYLGGSLEIAIMQGVVLALLCHLLLTLHLLFEPELPFSQPLKKGSMSGVMLILMILSGFATGALPLLFDALAVSGRAFAWALAGFAAADAGVEGVVRKRIARLVERAEFAA